MNILVVEDKKLNITDSLVSVLKKKKYFVNCTNNIDDGLYLAQMGIYDVILLDSLESKTVELSMLKNIRSNGLTSPVILLSENCEISDKVKCLDNGADDYLVKPYSTEELLARIRAVCRRNNNIFTESSLKIGNTTLNTSNLVLSTCYSDIQLTYKEYKLLEFLMFRKGMITSKDKIIEKIWGFDSEAQANHVEVYISFLRKKLSSVQSNITIKTIRGVGYEIKERK